jgi:hypothetical protein
VNLSKKVIVVNKMRTVPLNCDQMCKAKYLKYGKNWRDSVKKFIRESYYPRK